MAHLFRTSNLVAMGHNLMKSWMLSMEAQVVALKMQLEHRFKMLMAHNRLFNSHSLFLVKIRMEELSSFHQRLTPN
jgi:hypothetical protein